MFFKKQNKTSNEKDLAKVAALLIHAAKIDQNYTLNEENIIKKTIIEIGAKDGDVEKILQEGKEIEDNANQILDFTKEVKNMDHDNKIKIIRALWQIIYSNNEADIYESSLMRRLAGLLYIDNKVMGDIKDKIKNRNKK